MSLINDLIIEIQNEVPEVVGLGRRSNQKMETLEKRGKRKLRNIIIEVDEDE